MAKPSSFLCQGHPQTPKRMELRFFNRMTYSQLSSNDNLEQNIFSKNGV